MSIEVRKRLAARDDGIGVIRQQARQFGMYLEHNAPAEFSRSPHVTHEVDCITESLLGVNEQRPFGHRGPIPKRLIKLALFEMPVAFEAPFVLQKCLTQMTGGKEDDREIHLRLGKLRIDLHCPSTGGNSILLISN